MRRFDEQSGSVLVETVAAVIISSLILIGILGIQEGATESFKGCVVENRITRNARDAMGLVKQEIRSSLATSIETGVWSEDPTAPLLRFQQPVSFDSANGTTVWGADQEAEGWVEYVVVGDDLVRRVVTDTGAEISQRPLVTDIDFGQAGVEPVAISWDDKTNLVRIDIRRRIKIDGRDVKRVLSATIHVDDVLDI